MMNENENTCAWFDPSCSLAWIRDELQAFGLWLWESVLNGLATTFEALPIPDFMSDVGTYSIPPGVSWAAESLQIDLGLAIVVSAYTARFILRRVPVIG